jgi:hypothetical protein
MFCSRRAFHVTIKVKVELSVVVMMANGKQGVGTLFLNLDTRWR